MAHILSLIPLVGIGIVVSLLVFLYFEKRAITAKRQHEHDGFVPKEGNLAESFARYETQNNVVAYMGGVFIFTLFFSYTGFFTQGLTLADVFLYIFLTAFLGSIIILVIKFKRSILVKVFATFLYGAPLITASAFGFIVSYLFYSLLS
ncbi:hypothetical protein JWV37_01040 [Sulfurospirillum sp. T05]|uniref:Uncharacterized protein n=1 Tax=Sulfurospirillum tamanense TaxID=2813362 RepID=A0ABS2WPM2_9BACT|nr:hypothetical protein [Sulfurospirillum tamanensis]MBN2963353.1 hypothetical protein [Sulfurospirillum tamanensis]